MKLQYSILFALILSSVAFIAGGCSSGNSGVTFDDFRGRVSALAGSSAVDCGNANIGQGEEQNVCIGSAFVAQSAAFATYENQGIDSRSATALAATVDGNVFKLYFDGDPTGGGSATNGKITVDECINASLSGVVDGQPTEVFSCD